MSDAAATTFGIVLPGLAMVAVLLPDRFWRWFVSRRVICAHCRRIIRIGGPVSFLPRRKVSHGCCRHCSHRMLIAWRRRKLLVVRAGALTAVLFFLAVVSNGCEQQREPRPKTSRPRNVPHRAIEGPVIELPTDGGDTEPAARTIEVLR